MKIPALLLFISLLGTQLNAQDGIRFSDTSLKDALTAAKAQKKLIFVEGYVSWSEPCGIFEQYTLKTKEVGDYFNNRYINLRIDMEGYEGVDLAEYYQVQSYPAILFINSDGELVHQGCGALDADALLDLAREAGSSFNLKAMRQAYASGNRDAEFLTKYSFMLQAACLPVEGLADDYFSKTDEKYWLNEASWNMLNLNVSDPYSAAFQYFMKNRAEYARRYGADTVDTKLYNTFLDQLIGIYEAEDMTLFTTQALKKLITEVDFSKKQELLSLTNLKVADLKANWPEFAANAIKVVEEQKVTDPVQLNEFGWKFYLYVNDPAQLAVARGWMKKVSDTYPEATYLDTYASLSYRLGDAKEAVKYEKKALQIAEMGEEDYSHYKRQLQLFEYGKK